MRADEVDELRRLVDDVRHYRQPVTLAVRRRLCDAIESLLAEREAASDTELEVARMVAEGCPHGD